LRLAADRVSRTDPLPREKNNSADKLVTNQNTHQQVKSKILERMQEWTEMFSSNPDFGIMEQAYMKLKTQSRWPIITNLAKEF